MGPPADHGILRGIIPREVIFRNSGIEPLFPVTHILIPEGQRVIFQVPGYEDLPVVF